MEAMKKLPSELCTPEEVAARLRCSVRTVHRFVREKRLRCVQQSRRVRLFRPEHIEEFIERHTTVLPKRIDRNTPEPVPFPRKGGVEEITGCFDRAQLKEEMRSWL